jgi:sec-independent protein translocase protein TatA
MDLGWPEVLLILVVVLIVFGAGKLPQVASQLGKGIREFRKASRGDFDEEDAQKPAASATAAPAQITEGSTKESTK